MFNKGIHRSNNNTESKQKHSVWYCTNTARAPVFPL